MKKILIFSPPFSGHLNILKEAINEYQKEFDFTLVITGWENISPDLEDLKIKKIKVFAKNPLQETDPALWTFQRVSELLDDCLALAREIKPDVIIYDFFSLEGYFVGKILNIPFWCSIPAMIGPFKNKAYLEKKLKHPQNLQAIKQIKNKFGIEFSLSEVEMISDGLHLPGQINIVWSFASITPQNFKDNRHDRPYVFLGNLRGDNFIKTMSPHRQVVIYFSLGTVVMDNLWNQQDQTRENLKKFIGDLAQIWQEKPYKVIFITQGKEVLNSYPENWEVYDRVDQVKVLTQVDLFITHGGSNSFHEAVMQKVPMVVIPFFGDQILVGNWVEQLGIGECLVKDQNIDTHKSKDFLSSELVQKLNQAVIDILANSKYQQNYYEIGLYSISLNNLLNGKIPMEEGDLLYGTNVARKKYVDEASVQREFRILEFTSFSNLAMDQKSLPRIVDIYHDSLKNEKYLSKDLESELKGYREVLQSYRYFLGDESDITQMCLKGLDFFSQLYRIFFIVNDYSPDKNYITNQEILYLLKNKSRFLNKVTFIQKYLETWIPITFDQVESMFPSLADKKMVLRSKSPKSIKKVFLASQNQIKIEAIKEGLEELFPEENFEIQSVEMTGLINEQLVGTEELIFGVTQRLQELEKTLDSFKQKYDLLVSISNGIVNRRGQQWADIGIVLIKDFQGQTAIAKSAEMLFPQRFVKKANDEGFVNTTVGSVIGQSAKAYSVALDPHSYLTSGKVSRKLLLKKAFIKALSSLTRNKEL